MLARASWRIARAGAHRAAATSVVPLFERRAAAGAPIGASITAANHPLSAGLGVSMRALWADDVASSLHCDSIAMAEMPGLLSHDVPGMRARRGLHTSAIAAAAASKADAARTRDAEEVRAKHMTKVRDLLMGMPFLPRNGVTAEEATLEASKSAARLHELAMQLEQSLGMAEPTTLISNTRVRREMRRLGFASKALEVDASFEALVDGADADVYSEWQEPDREELLQLHRSGALGAVEMSTIRTVLSMDPRPWADEAVARAKAADAAEKKLKEEQDARRRQLKEEEDARRTKLKEEEDARRKKLKEEEDARRKQLKEEEDARAAKVDAKRKAVQAEVDRAWRGSRSTNLDAERELTQMEIKDLQETLTNEAWRILNGTEGINENSLLFGPGPAGRARELVARLVIQDVAGLATIRRPSATSNGRYLGGARGTGKSLLVMKVAEAAVRAIPDSCPYRVTALYVSAQDTAQNNADRQVPLRELWPHCIGRGLSSVGAKLYPEPDERLRTKWGYNPTTVGDWNFANRTHSNPDLGNRARWDGVSPERLLLVIDEFDTWYADEHTVSDTTSDWRTICERHGEVRMYVTGSPSIGNVLLYNPREARELFPVLDTTMPGIKAATSFNDTKLLQLHRLEPLSGDETLHFAFIRGRGNIRQEIVLMIEAEMPDFFDADRNQAQLKRLRETPAWASLASLLNTVALTPRQLEIINDAKPVSLGSGGDLSTGPQVISDLQVSSAHAAYKYCGRSLWALMSLTGLALASAEGQMCSDAEVKQAADEVARMNESSGDFEKWTRASTSVKRRHITEMLQTASDDGIVELTHDGAGRAFESARFRSESHRMGAIQYLLGMPQKGWTSFAVAMLCCNPAGSWGVMAESLLAVTLEGADITQLLAKSQQLFHAGASGQLLWKPETTGKIKSKFCDGVSAIGTTVPDTLPGLVMSASSSATVSNGDAEVLGSSVNPEDLDPGAFSKEVRDAYGNDLLTFILAKMLLDYLVRVVCRMQLKIGTEPIQPAKLDAILVRMLVGIVRLVDEDDSALERLGTHLEGGGKVKETVVFNILAALCPLSAMAARGRPPSMSGNPPDKEFATGEGPIVVLLPGQERTATLDLLKKLWEASPVATKARVEWPAEPQVVVASARVLSDKLDTVSKMKKWRRIGRRRAIILGADNRLIHIVPGVLEAKDLVALTPESSPSREWLRILARHHSARHP